MTAVSIESYTAAQAHYDRKVECYWRDEKAYLRRRAADPKALDLADEFAALAARRRELVADYERVGSMRCDLMRERDSALSRVVSF